MDLIDSSGSVIVDYHFQEINNVSGKGLISVMVERRGIKPKTDYKIDLHLVEDLLTFIIDVEIVVCKGVLVDLSTSSLPAVD